MSIVNLGKLSKPADTLIKKVSEAIGGVFEPWQIKRVAKAEAEANLIKAKSEIEITDLHRRAMHRFVEEEANRQDNMEQITKKAIPKLEDKSDPSKMDNDWVTNFFDKSRIISDTEMQELWANILAGESNSPGSYSKRTVNFLGDLDKKDAELFVTLCRFGWIYNDFNFAPLIFDTEASIYNDIGINFSTLSYLDSIGLIHFNSLSTFAWTDLPNSFAVSYYEQPLSLVMKNKKDNKLEVGMVMLTQVGQELASVCHAEKVDGFYDYVKERWKQFIPEIKNT
jgi:hypothetical protein